MKLTMAVVAAAAALLYTIIKTIWPSFPLPAETFLTLLVWALTVLFGLVIEPFVRTGLVKMGMKGFLKQ